MLVTSRYVPGSPRNTCAAAFRTWATLLPSSATSHLQQAVLGLRGAGHQDMLPLGLLGLLALHTHTHDFPAARHDLDATLTLATRCSGQEAVEVEEDHAQGASVACYSWGTGLRKSFEAHHDPDRAPC